MYSVTDSKSPVGAGKRFCIHFFFLLTIAALIFLIPIKANAALVSEFHREDAFAEFIDTVGCIRTAVQISPIEFMALTPPGAPDFETQVGLLIRQFDTCRDDALLLDASASLVVPSDDFKVFGNLESALLNTTLSVTDAVSGVTFPVSINMTWNGIGDLTTSTEKDHLHLPDCIINSRGRVSVRSADAFGSISFAGSTLELSSPLIAEMRTQKGTGTLVKNCTEELE